MSPAGLFCTNLKKAVDNSPFSWYNNTRRQGRHTSYGGLAQLGERLHGMQEVSGSIPLFSTKKALYFVGSMVLFFLLKPIFGGLHCFACTVFRLLQAVPIQPPTFDFTPFSKKNVCRPAFQQAAASSPSMYGVRSKLKVMLS